MGMLMHHTWLEQQKQDKPKAEPKPVVEEKVTEEVTEEIKSAHVRKTVSAKRQMGRRKTSK